MQMANHSFNSNYESTMQGLTLHCMYKKSNSIYRNDSKYMIKQSFLRKKNCCIIISNKYCNCVTVQSSLIPDPKLYVWDIGKLKTLKKTRGLFLRRYFGCSIALFLFQTLNNRIYENILENIMIYFISLFHILPLTPLSPIYF